MKVLLNKYPMGSFKGQKSAGRYIDGYLYDNLKDLAKVIVKDMTFLAVCFSSTLEVGTGKSVFMTQMGEVWSGLMKEMHGIDVPFTSKSIVWRPKDLIERAFEVPKYSFLLLDEWEDAHYWSELGMTLRQFFRKCRQLNLFIAVIIPNWFQLPLPYAVSRSVFAIDVRFEDGFTRGFFSFYNFEAKRKLFIKGRKEHNYKVVPPNFIGRFVDGYGVPESEYRKAKYLDLKHYEEDEPQQVDEGVIRRKIFRQLREKMPEVTQRRLSEGFGVTERTGSSWMNDTFYKEKANSWLESEGKSSYNNNLSNKDVVWNEEEMER